MLPEEALMSIKALQPNVEARRLTDTVVGLMR